MFEGFDHWKLLAGLGIFLFGMFLMEEAIKRLSGRAFKRFIRKHTSGRIKSIFSGVFLTSILQSSSAVSLMLLAFIGAGIVSMENAIGVILGSNIGTTATAWIVATVGFKLDIESFALPFIGSGGLGLIFLGRSERYSNLSKFLVGFGFLFMGLAYMKESVEVFAETFDVSQMPEYGIILYLLIGIALTAIMQSSSATMAVVLTALNAGILAFDSAASMVIGANIGTTVTVLLGAIGAVQLKKRVAMSHLFFNLVTGIIAFSIIPVLTWLVEMFVNIQTDAVIGLALFHTIFNVLGVIIFLPFIAAFVRLMTKLVPDKETQSTLYLTKMVSEVPEAALSACRKETLRLLKEVLRYNLTVLNIDEKLIFSNSGIPVKSGKTLPSEEQYKNLKLLQSEIFVFSAGIQKQELTEAESNELHHYMHSARMVLHSAKTLKDIKHNFDELENEDNDFLHDQYSNFRKKLVEIYISIDKLLEKDTDKDIIKGVFKIMKKLKKSDTEFVQLTAKAINDKLFADISVATLLLVNRAFVQSSKQILLAIRELLLSDEEIGQFDRIEEISDEILEMEN